MYEPDEKLVDPLIAALKMEDQAVRALIIAELESRRPEFEERQASAAERLHEAYTAAQPGEDELTSLMAEIQHAENEYQAWVDKLDSSDVGARVAANAWHVEWKREIASLTEKCRQMESDLAPLRSNRDSAKATLDRATADREALENNIDPALAYTGYGPSTDTYKAYRWGLPLKWALTDEDNPEHQDAKAHVKRLAGLTGKEANWKETWDEIYAQANKTAERSPSGADEITMERLSFEARAAERQASYIEDLRGVRLPNTHISTEVRAQVERDVRERMRAR